MLTGMVRRLTDDECAIYGWAEPGVSLWWLGAGPCAGCGRRTDAFLPVAEALLADAAARPSLYDAMLFHRERAVCPACRAPRTPEA